MLLPRLVGDELKDRVFVDVACAGHFTLALTQNGEVVVWGKINDRVQHTPHTPAHRTHSHTPSTPHTSPFRRAAPSHNFFLYHRPQVIPPTFIQFQEGRQCPIVQIKCGWAHAACVNSEGQVHAHGGSAGSSVC